MIEEPFADRDSLVARIDPRVRVVLATAYSFLMAVSMRFTTLYTALVLSLILIFLAELEPRKVAARVAPVNTLLVFLWAVLPITFEGHGLFQLGPFDVSREGILLSARITLKSNAILLALIALVASMPLATLGHALSQLRVPAKITNLLLMTYRYIFVIEQEYQRLWRAAKIRGFRPGTNLHTYRTYAYMVGMLFVRAAARAERVYQAMLCRGFDGSFYCLETFSATRKDWAFAVLLAAAVFLLAALEWTRIA